MNLVVYVSDALRADHLGCYGAENVRTPTLDALAARGVRFEQAVTAAPWTALSMTSLVTSLYPHRHGVLDWGDPVDPAIDTVFGSFSAGGYEVGSFVFDDAYLFRNLPEAQVRGRSDGLEGVLRWLRERSGPFFLLVHSWATHMPYNVAHTDERAWKEAKRDFIERLRSGTPEGLESSKDAYRHAIEYQSETLVASLLDTLDLDETVLAFLSDHGESWGERLEDREELKGVYHLHGATLYDEILRVPLVLAGPGLQPAVVSDQVRTVDVAQTLLDVAGLAPLEADGRSLLPLLRGEEQGDRVAVSATSDRGVLSQLSVRKPPWKLIRHLADGREEGYRLDLDPEERRNRAGEVPEELRRLLDAEAEAAERRDLSPEEAAIIEKRLADLGYL